jgi:hypothetical protein
MKLPYSIIQRHFRMIAVSLVSIPFFIGAVLPAVASETSMRGDYPACQNRCLSEHIKNVQMINEQHARGNTIHYFQDLIDIAVAQYTECIQGCKMVFPVK